MIKIKRSPNPPESLAIEAAKSYGSYREPDVVRQLKQNFQKNVENHTAKN